MPRTGDEPSERLRELLGGDPPTTVLGLPAEHRAALADLIEGARRRQAEGLEQAFAATLKHVPVPVRGIVRKVLLG